MNTATAVLAVAGALLLMWKFNGGKWVTKIVMVLAMFAAANLSAGLFGRLSHSGANTLQGIVTRGTDALFGVAVPGLLFLAAAFVVVYDLWPKHKATTLGVAAAFLLPLVATASSAGPAGDLIREGMTTVNQGTGGFIGAAFEDQQHQATDEAKNQKAGQTGGGHR